MLLAFIMHISKVKLFLIEEVFLKSVLAVLFAKKRLPSKIYGNLSVINNLLFMCLFLRRKDRKVEVKLY
jgi:hypothetical protein